MTNLVLPCTSKLLAKVIHCMTGSVLVMGSEIMYFNTPSLLITVSMDVC